MFENIEKIIHGNSDLADLGVPQTEQSITEAEEHLGVRFPESFRKYLQRWGCLSFGPNEYFGLGAMAQSVVTSTMRVRRARGLSAYFVVVCDHEGDEYVCLDTSLLSQGECPVIVWDSAKRKISRPRAKNFESFLETDLLGFLT